MESAHVDRIVLNTKKSRIDSFAMIYTDAAAVLMAKSHLGLQQFIHYWVQLAICTIMRKSLRYRDLPAQSIHMLGTSGMEVFLDSIDQYRRAEML
jgi:hypothetical protein